MRGSAAAKISPKIAAQIAAREARLADMAGKIRFPEDLPVSGRKEEIAAAISANPVVIVCGETGSGKTTQLPKICLELGRGVHGLIGHTQPRRLAARSVARRIAEELDTRIGEGVGVKIRFQDRTAPDSLIKLMTDGILLAESQHDPLLKAYDTIIIDEAHERSLNIDFLLGYLKRVLAKRTDLKVIITSATIDAERFSKHFTMNGKPAPVIEVSGRLYPVEVRWRPIEDPRDTVAKGEALAKPGVRAERSERSAREEREADEDRLYETISDAVDELSRSGSGDVLVFLPGEREIRDAAEVLRKRHPPHTEILPLYSRLSAEEQDRVFRGHSGRRVVLATNVAETSLTVPGIRYVVDAGLARVKRYSYRSKVEQLQIEKISRAAARQRAGRCGRVADGICIRLYDELDFESRSEFTDPEILRSSLASVILRMLDLKLGDVTQFPFIEPPPDKAIRDGLLLLEELGAVGVSTQGHQQLTPIGRDLARLPLDPRLGRMVLAARDNHCLSELMVIASALGAQDPRLRPPEQQQAADEAHRRIMFGPEEQSEFTAWLKLWAWYDEAMKHNSSRKLTQFCQKHFLSILRLREWRDIHGQLHTLAGELGWKFNATPATYEQIHRALLTGLLGNIGCKSEEKGDYLGARGIRFVVHPGSYLQKKAGKWLVAAELAETSRLFARCVARVNPEWIEQIGEHLIRRSYSEPHWEKKAMQVVAFERTTLHGLTLQAKRRVHYGALDVAASREIFIREGLVAGEIDQSWVNRWPFYKHNQKLIEDIEELEHKQRRQDVLVDDALIEAFYDARIPADVVNGAGFDAWRRDAEKANPKLLYLNRDDLMRHEAGGVTTDNFPPEILMNGVRYDLSYHFAPGASDDGVTLTLPLAHLNRIPPEACEWLVPGLLRDKVLQLLKNLPQRYRSKLVPLPTFADEFIAAQQLVRDRAGDQSPSGLMAALIQHILFERGLNARGWTLTPDAFAPESLPAHLQMNFRLVDGQGRQHDQSRSLSDLRARWAQEARDAFSQSAQAAVKAVAHKTEVATSDAPIDADAPAQTSGITSWSFGQLPELMELTVDGQTLYGYPALHDDGDAVSIRLFDAQDAAANVHRQGLLRLFAIALQEPFKGFEKQLRKDSELGMRYMPLGDAADLAQQMLWCALEQACLPEQEKNWPRNAEDFVEAARRGRERLGLLIQELSRLVRGILDEWSAVRKKLLTAKAWPTAVSDIEAHLARLITPTFVRDMARDQLQHVPRYLKAHTVRLERLKSGGAPALARDQSALAEWTALWQSYERRARDLARAGVQDERLNQFRWQLEELRVSLFAQELKTPLPVSVKRLEKAWQQLGHAS
ncbi:ATP-dependent RNA helicase HrpA [Fluviibacter phosphoraccumulans]|uniref:ATP-dependent RNA helicase HrpA n=1 Tax=Fluviibacter phosphoraccumulans TaxID=1751046 RepID=UPI0010BBD0DB|nr:ATP-dependent RNA helicase HrpA [Fluviibacter phosphoraccumulans]BCA66145.1 ATP-dependent helicase [Fluviibacter phosphoraccumulans]